MTQQVSESLIAPSDGAVGEINGEEPTRLYCLCKSADDNNMIGCDRCEEWYHFGCVGID